MNVIELKNQINDMTRFTISEIIVELSKRGIRVLVIDKNEPYVIASKDRHCIFGEGAVQILVIK